MDERRLDALYNDLRGFIENIDKQVDQIANSRAADERTRTIAKAHAEGWNRTADAISRGLRDIADAIRASR